MKRESYSVASAAGDETSRWPSSPAKLPAFSSWPRVNLHPWWKSPYTITSPKLGPHWTTPNPNYHPYRKVSLLPLIFLIFYEVSGGPFGVEDSIKAARPFLSLLGFLVFPFVWSIPEALMTAEMSTMFPENGGYVVWVSTALGPFWGFQQGWMKWLSGVIDNALYPVLFLDYLKSSVPAVSSGPTRSVAVLILTGALTFMNYRGLTIVGYLAVFLDVFSVLPFAAMGLLSLPKVKPSRWLMVDLKTVDWNLYLSTLFWNLNYWDSVSTLSGEVENPKKTLPKALFYALFLVVLSYFLPLLTGSSGPTGTLLTWHA